MEKEIKGTLEYHIKASEKEYSFSFTRSIQNELGACLATLELIKFNKKNLLEVLMDAKGKDKMAVKDRLAKVSTTEYVLTILTENLIHQITNPPVKAQPEEVKE